MGNNKRHGEENRQDKEDERGESSEGVKKAEEKEREGVKIEVSEKTT